MSEKLENEAKLLLEVKQALKNREFVPVSYTHLDVYKRQTG